MRAVPGARLYSSAIVELKDGQFMLKANPAGSRVRLIQAIRWGLTALVILGVGLEVYWFSRYPDPSQTGAAIGLAVFFVGSWFLVFFFGTPPWVKVSRDRVSVWGDYAPGRLLQRLPRSDLAYVFRGQAPLGRYRTWKRAYFLVTHDDTPQVTIGADDFVDDGMVALANRLNVPIKGDFSAQVQ